MTNPSHITEPTDAMLPCPFCGPEGTLIDNQHIRDGREVGCASCGARVHAFAPNANEKAIAAWNTRAMIAAHPSSDTVDRAAVIAILEGDSHTFARHLIPEIAALPSAHPSCAGGDDGLEAITLDEVQSIFDRCEESGVSENLEASRINELLDGFLHNSWAREEVKAYIAALSSPTAGGWKPIETANKQWRDGNPPILTWGPDHGFGLTYCPLERGGYGERTHWQPLPKSPETAK